VYFSEAGGNRIARLQPDGTVTTYAGDGSARLADASDPLQASFSAPRGIALGNDGALYVADTNNNAIRRIDAAGVTTLARDVLEAAGVAVSASGVVYVSSMIDAELSAIEAGEVHVLGCPSGIPGNLEGPGDEAHLRPMEGLLVDGDRLVFADTGNYRVRSLD